MKLPKVSIILPVRNEEKFIEKVLEVICNQTYPRNLMEIIIADGLSTDSTREIIGNYQQRCPEISIVIIDNPSQVVPTGFNTAFGVANGEIIIRVDGHTVIASDYVENCVDLLLKKKVENVGGRMDAVSDTYVGEVISIATSSPFGVGGAKFHFSNKEEFVDTVYLGAWPRRVFNEIGGFDEELVRDQDDEFNYRLRASGGKILLSPKIKSTYYPRNSLPKLFKQYFQYGYWKVRVLQKHPGQMRGRQFIPPLFVLSLIISIIFALLPGFGFLATIVPLLYIGVNIIFSIYSSIQYGGRYLFLLPVVFFTLHFSYGLGCIVGLFKFWNRWEDKIGKVPTFEKN